ncbi:hypothetical protein ABIB85_004154 [Bradyrhizobium sp. JR1.5]
MVEITPATIGAWRDQPVRRVPCHPCRGARHEEARLGPDYQHGFGDSRVASPFKSAHVAAKHGIAGKSLALELA